jgi:hypothetical protein
MGKQTKARKSGAGRPITTGPGKTVGVRCHAEFLKRIDQWRAEQPGGLTRPQAIRWLAEVGLRTKTAQK